MPHYEWQGAAPFRDRRNDREVEPGEVVELDEHVAGPHREFVAVDPEDESDAEAEADETVAAAPLNPTDFAVSELRDALEDADYSDEELDAIEDLERADGSARTTALDAIDAQR